MSLNKEKICHEISEDKIAVCKKTQGLRSGNFSDLNSACSKVLVPVKIFQFHDMHYESERYRDAANGLDCLKPIVEKINTLKIICIARCVLTQYVKLMRKACHLLMVLTR